jgi:hypothetical protein
MGWDEMGWFGSRWARRAQLLYVGTITSGLKGLDGMGLVGIGCEGMEWEGMGSDGKGWNGMLLYVTTILCCLLRLIRAQR